MRADGRRRARQRRAGGAVHPPALRFGHAGPGRTRLPAGRGGRYAGHRPRRLLREPRQQAGTPTVDGSARDARRVARVPLPAGRAPAVPPDQGTAGVRRRDHLRLTSRGARGQCLLPVRLLRSRAVHRRRRRRVDDDELRPGRQRRRQPVRGGRLPALAGHLVQRRHLLSRLRGQQRRVQGHGTGAVRQPAISRFCGNWSPISPAVSTAST